VWLGYPDALISTGEQGGGTPTSIWTAFMQAAKGDDCADFPLPQEPFQSTPFYGEYASGEASTGSGTGYTYSDPSTYSAPSTGGTTDDGGYDPRFYEAPPQEAPQVEEPEEVSPAPAPAPEAGGGEEGGVGAPDE
jgi:penicillin-binding protein 1A